MSDPIVLADILDNKEIDWRAKAGRIAHRLRESDWYKSEQEWSLIHQYVEELTKAVHELHAAEVLSAILGEAHYNRVPIVTRVHIAENKSS